jgi:hypothetical protein
MAQLETARTDASVDDFIDGIDDGGRREECRTVLRLMKRVTGRDPAMWGATIVGFGSYHFTYDSGREGDWFLTGFSPRKRSLTLYVMAGFDRWKSLMARLGKHTTGKSCLYIKRLSDIDLDVLEELVSASVEHMRNRYPSA